MVWCGRLLMEAVMRFFGLDGGELRLGGGVGLRGWV